MLWTRMNKSRESLKSFMSISNLISGYTSLSHQIEIWFWKKKNHYDWMFRKFTRIYIFFGFTHRMFTSKTFRITCLNLIIRQESDNISSNSHVIRDDEISVWNQISSTLKLVRDTRYWAKSTMQSMSRVLGRRHRLLHVRSLLTRWYDREQEVSQFLTSCRFRTCASGKVDHTVSDTERKKKIKKITLRINSKRSVRNENSWAFTIVSSVMQDSERPW